MTMKTALITGSTDGLGRNVALRLARDGFQILAHGRDAERGASLVTEIEAGGGKATFYRADFASLAAVRELAAAIAQDHARLELLVNNAGIVAPRRELSADGYELTFAVNYLSGYVLTRRLLPLLAQSVGSRIVNVSSAGQQALDFDDLMLARSYDALRAYRQSKLAQVMFTIDLSHELDSEMTIVNCLHPATYMDTTMVRSSGTTPISTVDEGADATMQLAVSPETARTTGAYYNGLHAARANPQAYDEGARAKLHAFSEPLV